MVYLSDATELGTIYTRAELAAISETCRELGLYLYLDGARMGAALVCAANDLQPEDFAKYCDAFYIGGTKNGLLFGEALGLVNDALKPHFRNALKQRGGMLAKGRLLGVQFQAFFENDLWLELARHADRTARQLERAFEKKGYGFYAAPCTNQLFPILPDRKIEELRSGFDFELNAKTCETHTAVRFVTSWATTLEAIRRGARQVECTINGLGERAPLYDTDSRVLILGSFPSVKSREAAFFYGHPQNRFWRVMARVLGCETPGSVPEKAAMLHAHHIALWDVIASCDISGSSDSSIQNAVPNDLSPILNAAKIQAVFCNGTTASRLYERYLLPVTGMQAVRLPSTSPANASFSLDRLAEQWQAVAAYL